MSYEGSYPYRLALHFTENALICKLPKITEELVIATVHILAGAAISAWAMKHKVHPAKAVAYGLVSHAVLDTFPHLEPDQTGIDYTLIGSPAFWIAFADNAVGASLFAYWYFRLKLPFWLSGFVSFACWSPDLFLYFVASGWWNGSAADLYRLFHKVLHYWDSLYGGDNLVLLSHATIFTVGWLAAFWLYLRYHAKNEKTAFAAHLAID